MEESASDGLDYGKRALGFEFKRMNNLIMRYIHYGLAGEGFDEITIMHGWILGFLYENRDRNIYQRDLETRFGIAKSTVTNILKLMEKKGYLTRAADKADARLKRLVLTELGKDIHRRTIYVIDRLHESMENGISDDDKKVFYGILEKIRNNIERQQGGTDND